MWVKAREREKNKEKHVNRAMFLTVFSSKVEERNQNDRDRIVFYASRGTEATSWGT
jgi:hypothetical protein